jgi:hypothetical protein
MVVHQFLEVVIFLPNNNSSITQVLYGEQNIKDTLSKFLSRQDGIDLCSDSKTTGQVLEIYRKISFDSNSRFLDIKTIN